MLGHITLLILKDELTPTAHNRDDHDLGVNDGGRDVKDLLQRRDLFLDFLNVDKNDVRRTRRGVYSSFDFGSGNETIRIILLDTRFGRSGYPFSRIGSFGEGKWYGKIFPLIAAFSRGFFALTGITSRMIIPGQLMLDRDQWMWLESQLQTSTAKINILVSSVQVLTRNPTVESWGQFPQERTRLLKLLDSTKPKGLLIISGDVHVGEAMSIQGTAVPVEVTSSGLTHTCTDGGISPSICEFVWGLSNSPNREGLLLTRNYGEIDIDWKRSIFKVTVRDIENDANFFEFIRNFDALPSFDYDRVPSISPEPIVQQQLITFVAAVFVFALIFVLHVLRIIR